MMEQNEKKYKVIFFGPANKDFGLVDKLVKNLQVYFGISAQNVTKMIRLAPITVKNGINLREANRYKDVLEEIGAKVGIEPISEEKHWAKTAKLSATKHSV
jgi:hypothetical protein